MRNRIGKRWQARRGSRWTRNTMANTFGLRVPICAKCRGCNPVNIGQPDPEKCCQCGADFVAADD